MFTITLESCSRSAGVHVHDALETMTTMEYAQGMPALGQLLLEDFDHYPQGVTISE